MANAHFDFRTAPNAERRRFDMPEGTTETVIGRASACGWVISSNAVSRRHARLFLKGTDVWVEDLGSSNGTFVNGERLTEPRMLHDQDLLQLGSVEATFFAPPQEAEEDATIAVVSRTPPPEPTPSQAAEPSPAPGGTGTQTVASPPPPPPAATAEPPVRAEAPAPAAEPAPAPAPPMVEPASKEASAPPAAPRSVAVPRSVGGEGGPSVAELTLIAAASFLLVFVVGAMLIRFVF